MGFFSFQRFNVWNIGLGFVCLLLLPAGLDLVSGNAGAWKLVILSNSFQVVINSVKVQMFCESSDGAICPVELPTVRNVSRYFFSQNQTAQGV